MPAATAKYLRQLTVRIAVAALLAGVCSAISAVMLPNSYTTQVLLALRPQPVKMQGMVPGMVSTASGEHKRVSFAQIADLEALPMPDYEKLFTSAEIALQVRNRLVEELKQRNQPTGKLTLEKVQRAMRVQSRIEMTSLEKVRYELVATLALSAGDPVAAANTANYWAELCIALAERLRDAATAEATAILEGHVESIREELAGARIRLAGVDPSTPEGAAVRANTQLEIQSLESSFREAMVSLQDARLVGRKFGPDFHVAAKAVPPETKSAPPRSLIVLVAVFLASLAVPVHFFGMIALRRYLESLDAPKSSGAGA
jgi:uncharacterized protein involved in exopolysaccharide biosynthesis